VPPALGFRVVSGADGEGPVTLRIVDPGSSFVSGPLASGSVVLLTQAPRGRGAHVIPAFGPVAAWITTVADPVLRITDAAGNATEVSCGDLPPRNR
jgi:hypothetical protein